MKNHHYLHLLRPVVRNCLPESITNQLTNCKAN
jgi:hypothetical protein